MSDSLTEIYECSCGSSTEVERPICHACLKPIPQPDMPALLRRAGEALKRAQRFMPEILATKDIGDAFDLQNETDHALTDLAAILAEMGGKK
jgi:hypothetical protein